MIGSEVSKEASRLRSVDAIRGLAIAGVVLFHIVWDLEFTGLISTGTATHPAWLLFGRTLAGSFMLLVGVSLALAHRGFVRWQPLSTRLIIIVGAALAISLVSKLAFPDRFIYFGILHAIAFASIVGALLLRYSPAVIAAAGILILVLPSVAESPLFDERSLAWIGFSAHPPPSNDYVPVFPWVGVTLIGLAITKAAIGLSVDRWIRDHEPKGIVVAAMAWMGRHSLAIYLIHQPVLLGLLVPVAGQLV
jgi:uncharacterized membrane protein